FPINAPPHTAISTLSLHDALPISVTHRLKTPQPSLEAAARCYARIAGINPAAFLATARSFAVDMKIRAADAQVAAMQVPSTPCIDRKSTRLNSSHVSISYAVFCLK